MATLRQPRCHPDDEGRSRPGGEPAELNQNIVKTGHAANLLIYTLLMKNYLVWAAALAATTLLTAQSARAPFSKVYIGHDGLAHVVDAEGKDIVFPKEQGQVAVDSPDISPDKQSAGWLTEEDGIGTSYLIPTGLLIYSNVVLSVGNRPDDLRLVFYQGRESSCSFWLAWFNPDYQTCRLIPTALMGRDGVETWTPRAPPGQTA